MQATCHVNRICDKLFPQETRLDLIRRYKHLYLVNIFSGTPRRGLTWLLIFKGRLNSIEFQDLIKLGVTPLINEYYPNLYQLYSVIVVVVVVNFLFFFFSGIRANSGEYRTKSETKTIYSDFLGRRKFPVFFVPRILVLSGEFGGRNRRFGRYYKAWGHSIN